jgi:hypothetical protein
MRTDKELVNRAIDTLINVTNNAELIKVKIAKDDVRIKIGGNDFGVLTVKTVTTGSKGLITNDIKEAEQKDKLPIILIADYIPLDIAKEFNLLGINYIESSGNTYLKQNNLWLFISGQKRLKASKTQQSRAFQETGIKLILGLLGKPELINCTYREISEKIEISLASTGYVMQELTVLNFLLKTNDKRVLKNKKQLVNRWVIAYHDVLRPRILKRKMRFVDKASYANWKGIKLNQTKEIKTLWGGEPAAAILTNHLKPSFFSIYTTNSWQECAKNLGLVPDENGDVEILQMFWNFINLKEKDLAIVPPILIYADLINSANDRNVETAEIVFDNELQYIK